MEDLSLVYLPTAVALGALHALEPGHAKTLTAAYLIGVKGTRRDAVVLGLAVAFTHSFVVIALSVCALGIGRQSFTDDALHWLQLSSAIIVILLGGWMLWRRWPQRAAQRQHVPNPVAIDAQVCSGELEIACLPEGERLRLRIREAKQITAAVVRVQRKGGVEVIPLNQTAPGTWVSSTAPAEPHEFHAELEIRQGEHSEAIAFEMHEPEHAHSHDSLSDDEHSRAHAAQLPDYVKDGQRPTLGQIAAFGAAGGLIPCPASITVMLLALSINQLAMGLLAVLGFSVGLALTLVCVGLAVVAGLERLSHTSRFARISRFAPLISAAMVILSGVFALCFVR